MKLFSTCLIFSVLFCGQAHCQIMVDGRNPKFTFSTPNTVSGNGGVRMASLLIDPAVREEIELLDNQKTELDKLITATGLANKAANDLYLKTSRHLKNSAKKKQARDNFQASLDENRKAFEVDAAKHLLPNQIVQLKCLAVVRQLEQVGLESVLSIQSPIGEALRLSPKEQEMLRVKVAKVRAKLKMDIAELKLKAVGEILSELPADKQNIIRDQFGIKF